MTTADTTEPKDLAAPARDIVTDSHFHSDSEDDEVGPTEVGRDTTDGFLDDIPDDVEELDLVHERLTTIENLGFERFTNLRRLSLRQNLLSKLHSLPNKTLTELDFYDNRLSRIENIDHLTNLISLDLSFNKIRHIERVEALKNLTELFFVANKISAIGGLSPLINLTNLELGANRIRAIENLDALVNLEQLWLGKNKITKLQGLDKLRKLRLLSVQSNRLSKIEGIAHLSNLEELYLSHNAITKIEGLEHNANLQTLDLSANRVVVLEGLETLSRLTELWMNDNKLTSYEDIEAQLSTKTDLETVYFERNPLQLEQAATYRLKIKTLLPRIVQIDAALVR
ncbi:hypothetical protein BDZ88DRAFT_444806 [Geranomyces variabilis]|nr:hypothetical protein BDZ88DRAFT_444806 [Geranomyces variabilis]KAJ3135828.1 hypothetical protein HDU90_003567 [Geranomyces variabilis]